MKNFVHVAASFGLWFSEAPFQDDSAALGLIVGIVARVRHPGATPRLEKAKISVAHAEGVA